MSLVSTSKSEVIETFLKHASKNYLTPKATSAEVRSKALNQLVQFGSNELEDLIITAFAINLADYTVTTKLARYRDALIQHVYFVADFNDENLDMVKKTSYRPDQVFRFDEKYMIVISEEFLTAVDLRKHD